MRPALFVFLAASALAQNPPAPAFDVASVKINQQYVSEDVQTWSRKIEVTPGNLNMRNVNMFELIKWAYHVQKYQIALPSGFEMRSRGGEVMLDSVRYDVLAKCSKPAAEDEMRPMLQTLLAERFKLALHRETRTLSVYAMVEAKGGHKMRPSQLTKTEDGTQDPQRGNVVRGVLLDEMAGELADSRDFNTPVINCTGLKGRFDFEINFRRHIPQATPGAPPPDVFSIIQEALQQEIGLKLEPRKMPVEVLVIERIEKTPVEN
jgi:uncharacterized protein (TIGR03435 family)